MADAYRLQPGDAVEIWVAQDSRLNRETVISPDGRISLPLAGQIQAQDLTVDELEKALSDKLAGYFKGQLDLTVMLQPGPQHMPMVFVVGEVNEPGSYPFRPSMTVLHAVSLSGGLYRTPMLAQDRDRAVVVEGELAQSRRLIAELTVRRARINTELADGTDIELTPEESAGISDGDRNRFLAQERRVLESRQAEVKAQLASQTRLKELSDSSIAAMRRQIGSVASRVELARQRLQNSSVLVAKGLAHVSAKLELEAEVAELEEQGDQFQNDLSALESTAIAEGSRMDTFLSQREAALLTELHDAERELRAAKEAVAEGERVQSIYIDSEMAQQRGVVVSYTVVRTDNGAVTEEPADETTVLRPGDLVRVTFTNGNARSAAVQN
ncbi:polysaccharide biosynthesis/export family protein [Aureimonas fodinaquatilis]|nr:polysaccharide biosynthesis/export family protein [Aureimonas fodinaquatilis]